MLKVGVFGVGHLGKFHLNNWKEIEGVELTGFFDPDDANAALVAEKYQLKRFDSVDTLIDASDAVDIIAPTSFHYEIAMAAIKKGKHVFVEKPLSNKMSEARELVKLAREANIKFQVGHVERFNPAFLALKDFALEPMFIEVHRLAQFNPRGTDVSVILDLMIHDIDIILSLVNSDVKFISANGVSVMSDTPDIANVRIEFDNGCVANLTSSRISMKKMRKMRLFQKDAYIGIDFLEKKAEVIKLSAPGDKNVFTFDIETNNGKKTIAIANPVVEDGNAIKMELVAFYNAIINNTETPVTVVDGFRAMEVAHQILEKNWQRPASITIFPLKQKNQQDILNQPRINISWYIIADIIGALITWGLFYFLRTVIYEYPFSAPPGFYLGALLYVLGWLSLHLLSGAYEAVYHKTSITEILRVFIVSLIGCLGLLFFFILKNPHPDNIYYYQEFFALLVPVFIVTGLIRLLFLKMAKSQIEKGKVYFKVLLVGSGKNASQFYQAFTKTNLSTGYSISSFLNINGNYGIVLPESVKKYNDLANINRIIDEDNIEEVIITVEKNERGTLTKILQQLSDKDVNIKITPDAVDIISGAVQTSNVMGVPLIDVHSGLLPSWQKNIKRFIDLFVSITALILLLPLLIYTAIRTKLSSAGGIFYLQERIGYKGIPFTIYKFRSMVKDAEKNGPMLSGDDDPRITKWGRVMRKWRLDELPQLWNIIKGEMSLVGPRPERKFYVDQILQQYPEYKYLFKVKPGLTSWGMVKFGYASSVDEMIQRMTYDLMYIENVSLLLDLRIMILTIVIIFKGEGK